MKKIQDCIKAYSDWSYFDSGKQKGIIQGFVGTPIGIVSAYADHLNYKYSEAEVEIIVSGRTRTRNIQRKNKFTKLALVKLARQFAREIKREQIK